MTILFINVKRLFPPKEEEFSKTERGFSSEDSILQKPLSVFTHISWFRINAVIFIGKFLDFTMIVLVIKFKELFLPNGSEF